MANEIKVHLLTWCLCSLTFRHRQACRWIEIKALKMVRNEFSLKGGGRDGATFCMMAAGICSRSATRAAVRSNTDVGQHVHPRGVAYEPGFVHVDVVTRWLRHHCLLWH